MADKSQEISGGHKSKLSNVNDMASAAWLNHCHCLYPATATAAELVLSVDESILGLQSFYSAWLASKSTYESVGIGRLLRYSKHVDLFQRFG